MELQSKIIPSFDGKYEIRTDGTVFSHYSSKVLAMTDNGNGYFNVKLQLPIVNGIKEYQTRYVHRLVAEAFLPNPDNLPIVMHLDNNPRHNYYKNLKWGAQKENIKQAVSDGRFNQCKRFGKDNPMYGKIGPMRGRKGINHPAYGNTSMLGKKLSEETKKKISISASLNIRIDYSKVKKLRIKGYSQQKIAKIMGIHQTSVSKILRKVKYG